MNIKDLELDQKIDVKINDCTHRGVTVSWLSKFKDVCEVRYDNGVPKMFDRIADYEITPHDSLKAERVEDMMSQIDFDFFHVTDARQSHMTSEVSRHPRDFIRMALEKWLEEGYIKEY